MAIVINELLAFLQHASNAMEEDSIVELCKSTFNKEEIVTAKQMLYEALGKTACMASRHTVSEEKSLQDIITLLKQSGPKEVPVFVARDLYKLPVMTMGHINVSSLLKNVSAVKAELDEMRGRLDRSESTIRDLRNELLQIKSNNSLCRSPDHSMDFVNTRRRGAQADTFCSLAKSDESTTAAAARSPPAAESKPSPTQQKSYANVAACPAPPPRAKTRRVKDGRKAEPPRLNKDESRRCDEEGFTLVKRRKKRKPTVRNHRGTAPYVPELRLRSEVPATPLYVSRLHWSMEVEDVVHYIREKTTFTLRVERLYSRHKVNFGSFVVRVPTKLLSTLEVEEFWPAGVVYRRFRGRLPNEARITSPPWKTT